jgi:hypothetical protein
MSLKSPNNKMSKSDTSDTSRINLIDSKDDIYKINCFNLNFYFLVLFFLFFFWGFEGKFERISWKIVKRFFVLRFCMGMFEFSFKCEAITSTCRRCVFIVLRGCSERPLL